MATLPQRLERILQAFDTLHTREEREMLLLGYADRFRNVPPSVAVPPYPAERKVPYCESDAYLWVMQNPHGTLTLHFAIENPSGLSAKALAAVLAEGLQDSAPEEAASLSEEIVERIFRRNISMGKGMGLTAMVRMVAAEAALVSRRATPAR